MTPAAVTLIAMLLVTGCARYAPAPLAPATFETMPRVAHASSVVVAVDPYVEPHR